MLIPSQCPGSFFGKHNFEGRFDDRFPEALNEAIRRGASLHGCKVPYERIYVCDICTRCGATINRQVP